MPLLALVDDRAAGRLVDAADDLHQRGLAGAVFTADRVNLAAMQVETDVRQRPYAGKFLGDGLAAKERGLRGGSGAAACDFSRYLHDGLLPVCVQQLAALHPASAHWLNPYTTQAQTKF